MIRTLQGRQKRLALRNDYRVESAVILCFPERPVRLTGKVAILQMYLKQKTLWSRTGVSCWTLRNVNPWSQVFSSAVFFGGAELHIGRLRCMFQAKEQQNPSIKEKAALRDFFCPKWDLKKKGKTPWNCKNIWNCKETTFQMETSGNVSASDGEHGS